MSEKQTSLLRRGPFLHHSAWVTQKRRSGGDLLVTVSDLPCPGIEPRTSRADSDVLNHSANRPLVFQHST